MKKKSKLERVLEELREMGIKVVIQHNELTVYTRHTHQHFSLYNKTIVEAATKALEWANKDYDERFDD